MISKDMDQIRELLIGDFSQEMKSKLRLIDERLDEIEDENRENIDRLSQNLTAKIEQMQKRSDSNYLNLEKLLNNKLKEHKELTSGEFNSIKKEIIIQKDFTIKSLNSLKRIFAIKLNNLKEDYNAKSVSKLSLASMFMEYSVKLKDSNIEEELEKHISKSNSDK